MNSKIKDVKKEYIVGEALEIFLIRGINDTTIKDVAEHAGIGEATVYRYFTSKKNLVAAVAERLQKSVYEEYFGRLEGKNGFEKCEAFFDCYLKIFSENPSYFKFVKQFDAFVITEGGVSEEYSSGVDLFKNLFLSAYSEGLADKSVRDVGGETFYFAAARAMLESIKKLAAGEKIVIQDETTDAVAEISKLKDIILFYLRP